MFIVVMNSNYYDAFLSIAYFQPNYNHRYLKIQKYFLIAYLGEKGSLEIQRSLRMCYTFYNKKLLVQLRSVMS